MICTATVSPKTMYWGDCTDHAGHLSCGVVGEPVAAKAMRLPAMRSVSSRWGDTRYDQNVIKYSTGVWINVTTNPNAEWVATFRW